MTSIFVGTEAELQQWLKNSPPLKPEVQAALKKTLRGRRIYPSLIRNELCGIKPMEGPVGQIFTLRYRYGD